MVVNGSSSVAFPVLSGIPFNTLSPDSHLTLSADDMLLYRSISSSTDYALLQDDINRISMWVDANCLCFNIQKCKVMNITKKQTGISVVSNCMDSYKYLGILLSLDLSWTWHIESLCSKMRKLTGLI